MEAIYIHCAGSKREPRDSSDSPPYLVRGLPYTFQQRGRSIYISSKIVDRSYKFNLLFPSYYP